MSESIETPPYHYVAYIDEAGDPGIERVRPCDEPGGSEWLVIGAMLIEASDELCPVQWVRSALTNCGSRQHTLHYVNLKERQKPVVCRTLANLPVNLFAMLSNKKNMRGHTNPRAAARGNVLTSKQWFYNYCLRLTLERITDCCLRHSVRRYGAPCYVKLIFSNRGGHSYGHAIAYNEILKAQSRSETTLLKRRQIKWQVLDRRLQETWTPQEVAGLQLADVVASSFYQAVDTLPPTIWNPQNAKLLKSRMTRECGFIQDYGVAFQPATYSLPAIHSEAELLPRQKEIFEFYEFDMRDF
jgi:hypothetical protein